MQSFLYEIRSWRRARAEYGKPKQTPLASPPEVYRDLFTAEIGWSYLRLYTKDRRTYQRSISAAQYAWCVNSDPEEREDRILTLVSTMFRKEILVMYLERDPDFKPEESIRDVRAYRQRNVIFAFSITFNDGYTPLGIPMDQEDSDRYPRLDPDDRLGFLMQLAIDHLTNMNAQDIVGRIDKQAQQKTGVRTLPIRQEDYTPEIITAISQILSVNLSRFNIGTRHGQNREWKVGNKSPYDDLDNRMSGTKISM